MLVTILTVMLHSEYLYNSKTGFDISSTSIYYSDQFHLLPKSHPSEIIYASDHQEHTDFYFRNFEKSTLQQLEIRDLHIRSGFNLRSANFYTNSQTNKTYIVGIRNRADYYLYEFGENFSNENLKSSFIYRNPVFDSLCDSMITINNMKWNSFVVYDSIADSIEIKATDSGYNLLMDETLFNSIAPTREIHNNETYLKICQKINTYIPDKLEPAELWEIINFFLRQAQYRQRVVQDDSRFNSFYPATILGQLDVNNDNHDDLLISINDSRWLPMQLLCYDITNKKLLWYKKYNLNEFQEYEITDIDFDGEKEIVLSSYSPCYKPPIDIYRTNRIGSKDHSTLMILDKNGELKLIKNKPVLINSSIGFAYYKFLFLPEKQQILFGLKSHNDFSIKKLQLLDLKSNTVNDLNVEYNQIAAIEFEDNKIIILNQNNNTLQKIIMNNDFKIQKRYSYPFATNSYRLYYNAARIDNINISFSTNPIRVYDNNFNTIFESHTLLQEPVWKGNQLFYIKEIDSKGYLYRCTFEKNKTLNPYLIVILLAEFLILTFYLLLSRQISIPISSLYKNYFILYNILGKLFYWKLKGRIIKSIDLSQRMSTTTMIPNNLLKELTESPTLIYKKNFLLFKYLVYEIKSRDESEIIQRISHEMKNQVLMVKLLTDKNAVELKKMNHTYIEQITSSLNTISSAAQTLSNFSHIDKLYLENFELNTLIEQLLINHVNHNLFNNINLNLTTEKIFIKLDKNLFRTAFDNLIINALEEITLEQIIEISIKNKKDKVRLIITNPFNDCDRNIQEFGNIGYSSKSEGSGIGLPIAKVIIEHHDGELDFFFEEKNFIVQITLPNSI